MGAMNSGKKIASAAGNEMDFALKDQNGETFQLSVYRGKKVVLSFHPLAWTGVCAGQMQSLEKNVENFASGNAIAVGISVDSVPCKKAWAEHLGITRTRLLSDFWPHGGIAQLFEVFRTVEGTAKRANIIIGEDGDIIFRKIYEISTLPPIQEVLEAIGARR
jgi:peroxiredoxin